MWTSNLFIDNGTWKAEEFLTWINHYFIFVSLCFIEKTSGECVWREARGISY